MQLGAPTLGSSWSRGWAAFALLLLLAITVGNVYVVAIERTWLAAAATAAVPLAAAWYWWRARQHGGAARTVADNMLLFVIMALGLYGVAVFP